MKIYKGQFPHTVEVEQTFYPSSMTAKALHEFLDDVIAYKNHDNVNPGWGRTEWVFPACSFDGAFLLIRNDSGFKEAMDSGLIGLELTEKIDGDDRDSITLVATDSNGWEKFRQAYVFER